MSPLATLLPLILYELLRLIATGAISGVKVLFRVALVLLKHCTAHLEKIPTEFYELLTCLRIKNMPPAILQPDFLIAEVCGTLYDVLECSLDITHRHVQVAYDTIPLMHLHIM